MRVLRYCDVVRWLEVVEYEMQYATDYAGADHPFLWRGLVVSARHLIDQAKRHRRFDKFGGRETVRAAEEVLSRVDTQLQQFLHGDA